MASPAAIALERSTVISLAIKKVLWALLDALKGMVCSGSAFRARPGAAATVAVKASHLFYLTAPYSKMAALKFSPLPVSGSGVGLADDAVPEGSDDDDGDYLPSVSDSAKSGEYEEVLDSFSPSGISLSQPGTFGSAEATHAAATSLANHAAAFRILSELCAPDHPLSKHLPLKLWTASEVESLVRNRQIPALASSLPSHVRSLMGKRFFVFHSQGDGLELAEVHAVNSFFSASATASCISENSEVGHLLIRFDGPVSTGLFWDIPADDIVMTGGLPALRNQLRLQHLADFQPAAIRVTQQLYDSWKTPLNLHQPPQTYEQWMASITHLSPAASEVGEADFARWSFEHLAEHDYDGLAQQRYLESRPVTKVSGELSSHRGLVGPSASSLGAQGAFPMCFPASGSTVACARVGCGHLLDSSHDVCAKCGCPAPSRCVCSDCGRKFDPNVENYCPMPGCGKPLPHTKEAREERSKVRVKVADSDAPDGSKKRSRTEEQIFTKAIMRVRQIGGVPSLSMAAFNTSADMMDELVRLSSRADMDPLRNTFLFPGVLVNVSYRLLHCLATARAGPPAFGLSLYDCMQLWVQDVSLISHFNPDSGDAKSRSKTKQFSGSMSCLHSTIFDNAAQAFVGLLRAVWSPALAADVERLTSDLLDWRNSFSNHAIREHHAPFGLLVNIVDNGMMAVCKAIQDFSDGSRSVVDVMRDHPRLEMSASDDSAYPVLPGLITKACSIHSTTRMTAATWGVAGCRCHWHPMITDMMKLQEINSSSMGVIKFVKVPKEKEVKDGAQKGGEPKKRFLQASQSTVDDVRAAQTLLESEDFEKGEYSRVCAYSLGKHVCNRIADPKHLLDHNKQVPDAVIKRHPTLYAAVIGRLGGLRSSNQGTWDQARVDREYLAQNKLHVQLQPASIKDPAARLPAPLPTWKGASAESVTETNSVPHRGVFGGGGSQADEASSQSPVPASLNVPVSGSYADNSRVPGFQGPTLEGDSLSLVRTDIDSPCSVLGCVHIQSAEQWVVMLPAAHENTSTIGGLTCQINVTVLESGEDLQLYDPGVQEDKQCVVLSYNTNSNKHIHTSQEVA